MKISWLPALPKFHRARNRELARFFFNQLVEREVALKRGSANRSLPTRFREFRYQLGMSKYTLA